MLIEQITQLLATFSHPPTRPTTVSGALRQRQNSSSRMVGIMKWISIGLVFAAVVAGILISMEEPRILSFTDSNHHSTSTASKTRRDRTKELTSKSPSRSQAPNDPRLRRLVEDDVTGYKMQDFSEFISTNRSHSSAILACYLLTDSDPAALESLKKCEPDPVVIWSMPYWKDRQMATHIQSSISGAEMKLNDPNDVIMRLLNSTLCKNPDQFQSTIRSCPSMNYSALQALENNMRKALESIGVRGTKAEILIEQRRVTASSIIAVSTANLNDRWKAGLSTLSGEERTEFTLGCLDLAAKFESIDEHDNLHLLNAKLQMAKTLPQDATIHGEELTNYTSSLAARSELLLAESNQLWSNLLNAEPPEVDRYFELRSSDPEGARQYLLDIPNEARKD
jgi:hypothetical protein